jgi:hypothetical protein
MPSIIAIEKILTKRNLIAEIKMAPVIAALLFDFSFALIITLHKSDHFDKRIG